MQFVWCLNLFETALPLKQGETYRQPDHSEPVNPGFSPGSVFTYSSFACADSKHAHTVLIVCWGEVAFGPVGTGPEEGHEN